MKKVLMFINLVNTMLIYNSCKSSYPYELGPRKEYKSNQLVMVLFSSLPYYLPLIIPVPNRLKR